MAPSFFGGGGGGGGGGGEDTEAVGVADASRLGAGTELQDNTFGPRYGTAHQMRQEG